MRTAIAAPDAAPAKHGLVTTALPSPVDSLTGDRWEAGFGFTPDTCTEPESWSIPCLGTTDNGPGATVTENRGNGATLWWNPFVVRASFKCDSQQLRSIDFENKARRIYAAGESKLIETELFRGDAAGYALDVADVNFTEPNLTLAQAGVTDLSGGGGAASPVVAIRSLVQAAAQAPNARRAMIHATPATVVAWDQSGALKEDRDGRLVTKVGGHYVVAGGGYTGEGPGLVAPAANVAWAYVTTPVYLIRGDELEVVVDPDRRLASTFNRPDNDIEVIVQRTAAYYWDGCLHAGIPVDEIGASI